MHSQGKPGKEPLHFCRRAGKKENLYVVSAVFRYTAEQEKEHAEIFYNHLKELSGENIHIDGSYPVDLADDVAKLLRMAQHNEYEEHDSVYKAFGDKAKEEGFLHVASSFHKIAEIEKIHGDRFGHLADLLEQNKLFVSNVKTAWMCLNCGFVFEGEKVPEKCPVCEHDRGYFIRFELSPYEGGWEQ